MFSAIPVELLSAAAMESQNNYDTSRRQKRSPTVSSQNMLQIFAVIPVELAKSEDCDFSCIKLALKEISVSRKYKSSQEISTILC